MHQPLTFTEVGDRIYEDSRSKWDTIVPPDLLRFDQGRLTMPTYYAAGSPSALQPNNWATNQLCKLLGMPADYFRKCPTDLQDQQFNYWADQRWQGDGDPTNPPKPLMLRAKNDQLRAVLTNRYAPIDNELLWRCFKQVQDFGLQVEWLSITDVSFHLRLVSTERRQLMAVGDECLAGIHLANSEVGLRSITVDALVHRLVCSNGLVRLIKGKSLIERRHVGAGAAVLRETLPLAIHAALREAQVALALFAATVHRQIDKPEEWIPATIARWQLSEEVLKGVLELMLSERSIHQQTLWSFINAVTAVAQLKNPDERYRMEALAGSLLEQGKPALALPALAAH